MPRLTRAIARTAAISATATAVSGNVARRQQSRVAQETPPRAESDNSREKLAKLQLLDELKAQDILDDAVYEAQKQRVLAS